MAKYSKSDGVRRITGEDGHGWTPGDGRSWVRDATNGPVYVMEKRRKNLVDESPDTGWYLYDDTSNGFFGEWCGSRILEAVDEANRLIAETEARHEGD
ncbi:hypothetical protein AB0B15_03530 [Streptomyces sp. NPDC045456]|uniref:hypothetical protein n=1 Tax=Streptomyces sp. NPDC045456 TaxID=3155254 RepID=UPI0033DDE29D